MRTTAGAPREAWAGTAGVRPGATAAGVRGGAAVPAHERLRLRDAERAIVWLRWLAMAAWPPILLASEPPVAPRVVWTVYAIVVAYVAATHALNRSGRAVRATALATTIADPVVTALGCLVTRGLDSPLYPFFYLTTLATSMRFGMRETLATVLVNAALSAALFAVAPGSSATGGDLAIRVFFLFFVALEGGMLSRAALHHLERRQEMLRRLMRAEEDERRRLAGELHDRVGRRLFELQHALDRGREEAAATAARAPTSAGAPRAGAAGGGAELLSRLADAARACADEVRGVTNELRPVVLDDFGFVEALREHVAALESGGDLAVSLEVDAPGGEPRGRPEHEVALFRALQEALANVRRHAGARRVDVRFAVSGGDAELVVRDDGRGFDPARVPRGHVGLLYMRERVEGCGGRLDVRSSPGAGTEVRVALPLGTGDPAARPDRPRR